MTLSGKLYLEGLQITGPVFGTTPEQLIACVFAWMRSSPILRATQKDVHS